MNASMDGGLEKEVRRSRGRVLKGVLGAVIAAGLAILVSHGEERERSREEVDILLKHDRQFEDMMVAFCSRRYERAREIAQELIGELPEGWKDLGQCREVLEDVPPEEAWNWEFSGDPWGLPFTEQEAFFLNLQRSRLPEDYDSWDVERKIAFLTESLNRVTTGHILITREYSHNGAVLIEDDIFVRELIRIGEPAVPALIEVLSTDERLTRSLGSYEADVPRDFDSFHPIMTVREAAAVALYRILGIWIFGGEPVNTAEGASATANAIQEYWEANRQLTFDERMMQILTDPERDPEVRETAAENLCVYWKVRKTSTNDTWTIRASGQPEPNPLIEKYSMPTLAEATLKAMDGWKAPGTDKASTEVTVVMPEALNGHYLDLLVILGDQRILPEILRRYDAERCWDSRLLYADTAVRMGNERLVEEIAGELKTGELIPKAMLVPKNDSQRSKRNYTANYQVVSALEFLFQHDESQFLDVFRAATAPTHPLREDLAKILITERQSMPPSWNERHWEGNKVAILHDLAVLDFVRSLWHEVLQEAESPEQKHRLQLRHRAVNFLRGEVFGMPATDEYRVEQDLTFQTAIDYFDRYREGLHTFTAKEETAWKAAWNPAGITPPAYVRNLDIDTPPTYYLPDYRALDQPATEADVEAGRAAFHLEGQGRLVPDLQLPAFAKYHYDSPPQLAIIIQAEMDDADVIHYGAIINGHGLVPVMPIQLTKLVPVETGE